MAKRIQAEKKTARGGAKAYLTHGTAKPKAAAKKTTHHKKEKSAEKPKVHKPKKIKSPKAKAEAKETGSRKPPGINLFWPKVAFEIMKEENAKAYGHLRQNQIGSGHAGYARKTELIKLLKEHPANKAFIERFYADPSIINNEEKIRAEGKHVRHNAGL